MNSASAPLLAAPPSRFVQGMQLLAMAMLYTLTGVGSDLLAVPPYYASAFWLPAGIAAIAALRMGMAGVLAAVTGAFAVNAVQVVRQFGWLALLQHPQLAFAIGCGAGVEAWLIARLLRLSGCWPQLQLGWPLIRAVVLVGPVACITSALIGASALVLSGNLAPSLWAGTMLTWWIGDVMGVLLALPLAFMPLNESRGERKFFRTQLLFPLVLVCLMAVLFYSVMAQQNQQRQRDLLGRETDFIKKALLASVRGASDNVDAQRAFFEASHFVSPAEFALFSQHMPKLDGAKARAYLWAPWLKDDAALAQLRQDLQPEHLGDWPLRPIGPAPLLATGPRLPIVYVMPEAENRFLRGLDIWPNASRWPVFLRAMVSGNAMVSGLVPTALLAQPNPALAVVAAVRMQQADEGQRGFVIGLFGVDALTAEASALAKASRLDWRIEDVTDPKIAPITLTTSLKAAPLVHLRQILPLQRSLNLGLRQWRLTVYPTPEFLQSSQSLNLWAAQLGSVLIAGFWGLFLLVQWTQNRKLRHVGAVLTARNEELRDASTLLEARVQERTTELHAASQQAHAAEKFVREITDNMPGVVFQVIRNGSSLAGMKLGFLSGGYERITGSKAGELAVLAQQLLPEDRPALIASLLGQEARERGEWSAEFRIRLADGTVRWTRAQAYLASDINEVRTWNGFWVDITERKQADAALSEARDTAERANRAKSDFLAMMSHEIRTPMNSALGLLELAQLTNLDDEQRTLIEAAHDASRSLLRLIDDLLDFSRIEAGRLELDEAPAAVPELIERVAALYGENISAKGLNFAVAVAADLSPAHRIDRLRLRQILSNLLSNALKFTEQGNIGLHVSVLASRTGWQTLRFCVSDTGIGIDGAQMQRVFQPFAQANAQTWQRFGGSGLGLSISRRLAELMGGSLTMHSSPGQGTQVMLDVDLACANTQELDLARQQTSPQRLSALRRRLKPLVSEGAYTLLAADDHAPTRLLLSRQFRALGVGVVVVRDGLEALEHWHRLRPALVLTDCNMPGMDGYALARQIRQEEARQPPGQAPTIIIGCSAGGAILCPDMDMVLGKPLELETLERTLAEFLPSLDLLNRAPPNPPAAAASNDRSRAFDTLAELSGGDAELAQELVIDFARGLRSDAADLMQALASQHSEQAAQAAHRLKGGLRAVGALGLAEALGHIEASAQAGFLAAAAAGYHAHAARVHQLYEELSHE